MGCAVLACVVSILEGETNGRAKTAEERFERVRTLVFPSSEEPCRLLAQETAGLIRKAQAEGRNFVLGLATGSTPVPFYRELIRLHREEGLSFTNLVTFNLDEYCGLSPDHPESYHRFMHDQLFDQIDIPRDQIHIPDGTVRPEDEYRWCQSYEERIEKAGGLDLQVLGIGRTGHIGFNEPGSTRESRTRMISLDRTTRRDAASDFRGEANVPRFAITMGVGTILGARRVVLLAWGENKAEVIQQAIEGEVSPSVAASFLQEHAAVTFLLDRAAASQLTRFRRPWLVRSVEWDQRMRKKSVIWLARQVGKPVLKLVDEDYNENGMAELLTKTGTAYRTNIEVFNLLQHTITGWPGGKPDADDANRPERKAPTSKRVVVLSPEPQDVAVSMGGTLERLVEQGHRVTLLCQTSGNLRVADAEARKFASALGGIALTESNWSSQRAYAERIQEELAAKGEFGVDSALVRNLKGLMLRGEARDAAAACRLPEEQIRFLDLPFYESGRYRRFRLGEADIRKMVEVLEELKPHSIFATGDVADPSSLQALCFEALVRALRECREKPWIQNCRLWLYRGREKPLEPHEIDMAVPMSPGQLESKIASILKFQSIGPDELESSSRNRRDAVTYDKLGMAEYEAIEAFQRWPGLG